MSYAFSLLQAISIANRKALRLALVTTVACIVVLIVSLVWSEEDPCFLLLMLIPAVLSWSVAVAGSSGVRALRAMRRSEPEHWLPSSSHGLVAVVGDQLLAGGVRAALDRHAKERVGSISFDEDSHSLTIDLMLVTGTRDDREEEEHRRVVAKLDRAVTPERAFAFAKHVLGLSQR